MRRLVFTLLIWLSGVLSAQDFGAKTQVSLLVEPATAKAGDTIDVALHLKMPDGWHTYWRNPGENGIPTTVKWTLPEGVTAGAIHWPVAEKVEWLEMFTYAYHHEALLIIPFTLSADLAPAEYELKGKVEWLECEETCIPGEAEVAAKLVVGNETKAGTRAALFQKWRARWPDKNEMPQLPAQWAGVADADGERTVRLTVPVSGKDTKVHFLPYSTTGKKWEIAHATKLTRGEGEFTLAKTITSKDGQWPTEVSGVVRYEENGKITAHETVFQIGSAGGSEEPFGFGLGLGDAKCVVSARLDHEQAAPGTEVLAGVSFSIPKDWHIFWKKPGAPGLPPSFTWTLPEGITAGEIKWPQHTQLELFGEMANVYEHQVMLLAPLAVSKGVAVGEYKIGLKVEWQEPGARTDFLLDGLLRGHAGHLEEERVVAILQPHEVQQELLIEAARDGEVVLRMRGLQRARAEILAAHA